MKTSVRSNSRTILLAFAGTFVFVLLFLKFRLDYDFQSVVTSTTDLTSSVLHATGASDNEIPNTVHYVYILKDGTNDFHFKFSEILSVYSTQHYWKPDTIYLHTNAPDDALVRARSGAAGKWTKLLFDLPALEVVQAEAPVVTNSGKEIKFIEHRSDFVRVAALQKYGGTYLDFDVHALRDIKVLRQAGFDAVTGRQEGTELNSGTFMTKAGSKMIDLWHQKMQTSYNGDWTAHSNGALTLVGDQLIGEPGELLAMERDAFAPGSWLEGDTIKLLEVHDDAKSNLDIMDADGHLPEYGEDLKTRLTRPTGRPDWAFDWARTYLLHAFHHNQGGYTIPGFTSITPRYVLDRRSNFARAVYPVARDMYEKGLIGLDDFDKQ